MALVFLIVNIYIIQDIIYFIRIAINNVSFCSVNVTIPHVRKRNPHTGFQGVSTEIFVPVFLDCPGKHIEDPLIPIFQN